MNITDFYTDLKEHQNVKNILHANIVTKLNLISEGFKHGHGMY